MSGYNAEAEATLKTKVKNRIGNPDTDLLSDDELDEVLDSALARVNELSQRVVYGYITTVKNQNDYVMASDRSGIGSIDNFLGVREAYWDPISISAFNIDEVVSQASIPLSQGLHVWENPSLVEIHFQKLSDYQRRLGGRWSVVEKTGGSDSGAYLRLIPAPGVAGTIVYFEALQGRTLADLEKQYQEPMVDLCVGKCKMLMAERLSLVSSVSMGGRSSKFDGSVLNKNGSELIVKAESKLRGAPPLYQE